MQEASWGLGGPNIRQPIRPLMVYLKGCFSLFSTPLDALETVFFSFGTLLDALETVQ